MTAYEVLYYCNNMGEISVGGGEWRGRKRRWKGNPFTSRTLLWKIILTTKNILPQRSLKKIRKRKDSWDMVTWLGSQDDTDSTSVWTIEFRNRVAAVHLDSFPTYTRPGRQQTMAWDALACVGGPEGDFGSWFWSGSTLLLQTIGKWTGSSSRLSSLSLPLLSFSAF